MGIAHSIGDCMYHLGLWMHLVRHLDNSGNSANAYFQVSSAPDDENAKNVNYFFLQKLAGEMDFR